jgi:predicted Zn-dependent protease
VGRVKDAMIAGNVYEMFRQVEQVGNAQACLGNYYLPFVKFAGLKVATRS